jgi:NAD(P)-dependent dehydrogenase (short-subunit alcohol dehydrogenase family)
MSAQKYLITGASGGLGLELARKILREGRSVVAAVLRPDAMAELADEFANGLLVERLDVTNPAQIRDAAARHDDVDVIINNAGGAVIGAMEELSDAEVKQQLDLNLLGPINITRAFLPALRAKQSGRIVYITSIGGRVGFASGAMYHAAKFGLEGFAEAVAQEISEFGIRTLIIEPGSMKTNFQANIRWTRETDAYRDSAVGAVRRYIKEHGEENNAGDPVKIATAIYDLTQQDDPPLRTALGVDTFATLQKAYGESLKTLESQKALAESVAFEGKTGFMPTA